MVDGSQMWRAGRYAAIDIGTVTCRMLVADVDELGCLHELDREYEITNLGVGVDATGVLSSDAMNRVVSAIGRFKKVLSSFGDEGAKPIHLVAMATSAARDARNSSEFMTLLAQEGIELSVIPGQKEAALSFKGASCDFADERLVVVDIGGGSTEVVVGRAGRNPEKAHSFNVGCRRVTERFLLSDPPTSQEILSARSWISKTMAPFFEELKESGLSFDSMVAVAGTATSVVTVQKGIEVYDTALVHRSVVERSGLDKVADLLLSVPTEQRANIVGLDPGRAPVIVAGMLIMQTVMDLAQASSFVVSDTDILHGIIMDAAAN